MPKSKAHTWGGMSIFDDISEDDLTLAFFPCTRFEAKVPLLMRGEAWQQKNWDDIKKLEYSMQMHKELSLYYNMLCQLVIICKRKGLRLVIENPCTQPHYLTSYWCMKPAIIDKDRTANGDYYKKPTQYWFINCEPKNNLVFEPIEYVERKIIEKVKRKEETTRQTERSMMHPQYARRFIKQYLIDEDKH